MNPSRSQSILIAAMLIVATLAMHPLPAANMGRQHVFNIRDFGAKPDKSKPATMAIQKAIDACTESGGGMVYVPPGDYLMGPIHLRNHVELHIEAGATLWADPDKSVYFKDGNVPEKNPRGSAEPHTELELIMGVGLKHIAITGRGTIHGQGARYWWGIEKYRPYILTLRDCENVLFEGVTTLEAPTHTFGFRNINRLTIRNVTLFNDPKSPNTDGFHIYGCRDVHISEVTMDTGDDCIVVGGGTRDMTITNCTFRTPWGVIWINDGDGITLTNCVVECQMLMKDVRRANHLIVSDIVAYGEGRLFSNMGGGGREWKLSNIIAHGFAQAGWVADVENITLNNVKVIREPGTGSAVLHNGLDFKNVRGLTLRHVEIVNVEEGPGLICENVADLEIDGFMARGLADEDPAVLLKNVDNSYIHACRAEPGTRFLKITGDATRNIRIAANDLRGAKIVADKDVPSDALQGISVAYGRLVLPKAIHAGESITVETSIANRQDRSGFCPIILKVDGKETASEWRWLEGGQESAVVMMLPPFYRAERHTFAIGNAKPVTRKIIETPARLVCKSIEAHAEIVRSGESVQVTAEVQNVGSRPIRSTVSLLDGKNAVSEKPVHAGPGEVVGLTFEFTTRQTGIHELSILDSDPVRVKAYEGALNSLVLHLDMETIRENRVIDQSGLGHDLLLKCNPGGRIPKSVPWKFGNAIAFDGNTSYGEIEEMLLRYPMTLSVWLNPDTLTPSSVGGRQMILFASEPRGNDGFGPEDETHLARDAGDVLAFTTRNANRFDVRQHLDPFEAPVFVTVVYDTTSRLYINGEVADEVTGKARIPDYSGYADKLFVGRPTSARLRFYHGVMDELRMYHEALSEGEVRKLYESY